MTHVKAEYFAAVSLVALLGTFGGTCTGVWYGCYHGEQHLEGRIRYLEERETELKQLKFDAIKLGHAHFQTDGHGNSQWLWKEDPKLITHAIELRDGTVVFGRREGPSKPAGIIYY